MNIVHVGYGYWGSNVVKNLSRAKDINLMAICDMNSSQLEKAKLLYGNTLRYENNYMELLDEGDIDAFTLAVQTEPSFKMAKDILGAGKHLFIEKPIATNTERARKLNDLAKRNNLILHCDHIMIYHPIIRHIKKMIDSGELGEVINIEVLRSNLGPIRKDVNAMMDLAVHDIAVIDYLTGGSEPLSVHAVGEVMFGNQEVLTFLNIKYENFMAHIKSSWVSPIKERITLICGSKKMLIFDDVKSTEKLSVYDCGFEKFNADGFSLYDYKARNGNIAFPQIPQEDALLNSIEHFANCILTNSRSLSGGEESIRVMNILDAAQECLKNSLGNIK